MKSLSLTLSLSLALVLAALPSTSSAELMQRDFITANDGLLTYDTETNLEWLDVTQTINMSFNDVMQLLGPNGSLTGFRYATGSEVTALLTFAGISSTQGAFTSTGEANNVRALIKLLGQTGFPDQGFPGPATRVIYGDAMGVGAHARANFGVRDSDEFTTVAIGVNLFGPMSMPDDESHPTYASFLVRVAPVPEPSSFALMLVGLLPIWFGLRRIPSTRKAPEAC